MCIVSVLLRMQYSSFSNLEATRKNIDPLGRIKIRFNSICIKSIVPGKVYCFSDIGMQQLFFPMCFSLSGKKMFLVCTYYFCLLLFLSERSSCPQIALERPKVRNICFFSSLSLKTRKKCISFAQLVWLSLYIF